jgi:hypothetical protein
MNWKVRSPFLFWPVTVQALFCNEQGCLAAPAPGSLVKRQCVPPHPSPLHFLTSLSFPLPPLFHPSSSADSSLSPASIEYHLFPSTPRHPDSIVSLILDQVPSSIIPFPSTGQKAPVLTWPEPFRKSTIPCHVPVSPQPPPFRPLKTFSLLHPFEPPAKSSSSN